ncbi:MAG: response regulator [Acidobacteriota bacterium]
MRGSVRLRLTESKFRLLYLGNDLGLISALKKALGKADYVLVSCSDRESAIVFLKSDIPYQLLLIDFEWRGREGLKLASLARLLKHRQRMPTVLVTASELSRRLKVLARNAGVNECVAKTPDMGAIIETIRRLSEGRIGSAD